MAESNYHSHPYIRSLDDYQTKLVSCSQLCAHLLDEQIDSNAPDWQKSAAWLMRDMLIHLAENVPFPKEDFIQLLAQEHQS